MKYFLGSMILISLTLFLVGCSMEMSKQESSSTDSSAVADLGDGFDNTERVINIDKLEIFHFHAARQCYSCITVGEYAKETVETYFADELNQGLIVFKHVNAESAENRDTVLKYGATGSSIWLGAYVGEDFKAEENTNVWYRLRNKQDYMDYFRGVIEDKLAGN